MNPALLGACCACATRSSEGDQLISCGLGAQSWRDIFVGCSHQRQDFGAQRSLGRRDEGRMKPSLTAPSPPPLPSQPPVARPCRSRRSGSDAGKRPRSRPPHPAVADTAAAGEERQRRTAGRRRHLRLARLAGRVPVTQAGEPQCGACTDKCGLRAFSCYFKKVRVLSLLTIHNYKDFVFDSGFRALANLGSQFQHDRYAFNQIPASAALAASRLKFEFALPCSEGSTGVVSPRLYLASGQRRCPNHGNKTQRGLIRCFQPFFDFPFSEIICLLLAKAQLRPLGLLPALRSVEGRGAGAAISFQWSLTPPPITQQQHSGRRHRRRRRLERRRWSWSAAGVPEQKVLLGYPDVGAAAPP